MEETLQFQKRLTKIKEEMGKKELAVRKDITNIEKIRIETLKKTEKMKYSAQHEIDKLDQAIIKDKKLGSLTKQELVLQTEVLRNDVEKKYDELRSIVLGK